MDASSLQRLHADLKGDRRDRTMLPLPDHLSSPEPTMPGDGRRRSSTSADSGVGLLGMQMQSGVLPRSFRSPRPTPRQSSGLSSVPEVELTQVDGDHRHAYRSRSGSLLAPRADLMNAANQSPTTIFDQMIYAEPENESSEESQMRRLRLGESDRTPPRARRYSPNSKAGQKRRASSPPREQDDRHTLSPAAGNSNELFHRRSSGHLLGRRTPPLSRFPHSSLSSASSVTRASSTVSSTGMTLITNSLTSLSSHDRLSPSGHSPGSELGSSSGSPYVRSSSLNPSPRDALARAHHRAASEVKSSSNARKVSRDESALSKSQTLPRRSGVLFCDCCPKKPRRFETADELR